MWRCALGLAAVVSLMSAPGCHDVAPYESVAGASAALDAARADVRASDGWRDDQGSPGIADGGADVPWLPDAGSSVCVTKAPRVHFPFENNLQNAMNPAELASGVAQYVLDGRPKGGYAYRKAATAEPLLVDWLSSPISTGLTIALWVKPQKNDGQSFFGAMLEEQESPCVSMLWLVAPNWTGKGELWLTLPDKNKQCQQQQMQVTLAFSAGTWTHLALRQQPGTLQVFVNGEGAFGSGSAFPAGASLTRIAIGSRVMAGESFDGLIDEVMLFEEALTDTEIKNLHTTGCP